MSAIDYYNIILACFSACITLLLGFQIFQILNIEKIRKEIIKEKEDVKKSKRKMMSLLYYEIAKTYFRKTKENNDWVYKYKYYILLSIYNSLRINDLNQLEIMNEELEEYQLSLMGYDEKKMRDIKTIQNKFDRNDIKTINQFTGLKYFLEYSISQ